MTKWKERRAEPENLNPTKAYPSLEDLIPNVPDNPEVLLFSFTYLIENEKPWTILLRMQNSLQE